MVGANYLFYSQDQQQWIDSWDGQTGLPSAIRVDLATPVTNRHGESVLQVYVSIGQSF